MTIARLLSILLTYSLLHENKLHNCISQKAIKDFQIVLNKLLIRY